MNSRILRIFLILLVEAGADTIPASGQLAVTEVQSNQSGTPVLRGTDYWELTNFGSDPVDLSEYYFVDDPGFTLPRAKNLGAMLQSQFIQPLESMIFADMREGVLTTAEQFREWWGPKLDADVRIAV